MFHHVLNIVLLSALSYVASSQWLAIDNFSVRTWNENNGERTRTLTTFQVTNYPSKYVRGLENRIDIYSYDPINRNMYFIMDQALYGISKIFKYNSKLNQIDQTNNVQPFMIDQIQYNPINDKLYAIIRNDTNVHHLVEVNIDTLEIKRLIFPLDKVGSSMSGSYFDTDKQLFTYHAYNFVKSRTELITLNLTDNASEIVINSKPFDFNVFGFGYIRSVGLVALWQYSIITPLVCIQIDEMSGKQIKNVTVTPKNVRIAQGYQPFSTDMENRLFYVLSGANDLSTTYISKIRIDTLQSNVTIVSGQQMKDYIFFKLM